jgi:hypothetical protein
MAMRIVAAKTIYDPNAMWGINKRTSTRKASRARINVRMLRMKSPSRYRGEWEGEWKCAVPARMSMMRVKKAATG